jgi:hypothetical protein
MAQEEKELLIRDICGRLPYGVKVQIDFGEYCIKYGIDRYIDDTVICVYPETFEIGVNNEDQACDIEDVKPYLRKTSYKIPIDYAYPVYGWGVKFNNDKFVSIVSSEDSTVMDNEHIRYERATFAEILEVKELVEENFGKPASGNILYHLDTKQLENYAHNEIDQILAY